ncbi:MAG: tRNA (N6-threonylcarbamoyladenosine(37)-N6)-methyltransferase TrmO [Syntrophomonadaceae bacterium]|jgi:tRNA-Thr(GGU) m(6)t(6)A37 methyltransferase TsaA
MDSIMLKPVGQVISDVLDPFNMPFGGRPAIIEVFPEYEQALLRIEENSHIWVLGWFHKASRDVLRAKPFKINPLSPEFGVFALRTFNRPNPIALSLAKVKEVKDRYIYVESLDAIAGTPIIDIKPYFENDIVFSPMSSYIKGKNVEMQLQNLKRHALTHHQEECRELYLAIKMAVIAEDYFGKLNSNDLLVKVIGSPCLGDCIQGVTRARLANPQRFSFQSSTECSQTVWKRGNQELSISLKAEYTDDVDSLSDAMLLEELFNIDLMCQGVDTSVLKSPSP